MIKTDPRLKQLDQWLTTEIRLSQREITPASSDASFRRYFRISFNGETRIVMDAPPEKEQLGPFIQIANQLDSIGLHVPKIEAINLEQGFLLMSDLGSTQYLSVLDQSNANRLYGDAMGALAAIQCCGPEPGTIPPYNKTLLRNEMELFREWYLGQHLNIELSQDDSKALSSCFEHLVENAIEQPQVAVHRDYHSRNLMLCDHNPGILDFQDAVTGAVTYDLVSLLRDCYIEWPQHQVESWVNGYHDLALDHGILKKPQSERFLHWFDLMGVQRHLKAIGIFARLNHRDGKPGYLDDIPRTLNYIRQVASNHRELAFMQHLIDRIEQTTQE